MSFMNKVKEDEDMCFQAYRAVVASLLCCYSTLFNEPECHNLSE